MAILITPKTNFITQHITQKHENISIKKRPHRNVASLIMVIYKYGYINPMLELFYTSADVYAQDYHVPIRYKAYLIQIVVLF